MSDELQPAMSAAAWKGYLSASRRSRQAHAGHDPGPNDQLVAWMAMNNDELPDDSPYKITREDVELVLEASQFYQGFQAPGGRDLERLAAKLAALLPPEEP